MYLETRWSKAATAAERWDNQYKGDRHRLAISKKIKNLGSHPNPDKVNQIIGNTAWTDCTCWECMQTVDAVVVVGQKPDYDSITCYLCLDCAKLAVDAFSKREDQ